MSFALKSPPLPCTVTVRVVPREVAFMHSNRGDPMRLQLFRLVLAVVCASIAVPSFAQEKPRPGGDVKTVKVKGKITKMDARDQFVIRTADNKDVTLFVNPQTRVMVDGRAARIADLRVGSEINAAYIVENDRFIVN